MEEQSVIIFICLIFSALFSGIEIAFISSNKLKIEVDRNSGIWSAAVLSRFTQMPSKLITALLVGNNIALVIYGIYTAKFLTPWIEDWLPINSDGLTLIFQTLIGTFFIVIFAEFLPKILFRINANRTLSFFAPFIILTYYVLYPIVFAFLRFSDFILKHLFRVPEAQIKNEQRFTPIDIDHYINEFNTAGRYENDISQEIQMVQNVMDLKNVRVRECMVPRPEIVAMEIHSPLSEINQKMIDTGLSKVLIYKENIDNIVGYVHAFDMFKKPQNIRTILREISTVPEALSANKLLKSMIDEHKSIAVVVDEFGGTSGIVALEDLMEEIFGEIEDEFDSADLFEKQLPDGKFIFSGRMEIDYLNEKYNLNLPTSDEYETLGGLITFEHQSIPAKNEEIMIEHFSFRVLQATDTRVEKVLLTKTKNSLSK